MFSDGQEKFQTRRYVSLYIATMAAFVNAAAKNVRETARCMVQHKVHDGRLSMLEHCCVVLRYTWEKVPGVTYSGHN